MMKKEKAWELLANNYVVVLAQSFSDGNVDRMRGIIRVVKEYIPGMAKRVTEKPKVDGDTMKFGGGKEIDYYGFDIAYADKHDKHIIYLKGDKYVGAFYVFEKFKM